MKRTYFIPAMALVALAGLSAASCSGGDKKGDTIEASETLDRTVINPEGDTTTIRAVENPDGAVTVEETLPTEVVTAKADDAASGDYTTTASGLKYKVIKKGSGARPTATSTVKVKYTGKLQDGTVFDSTDLHGGQPAEFPLNRVIPGWTEGLQLMQPGAIYEFVIPSNLAYGPGGVPGKIPGGATLVFDVELLQVQ